MQNGTTLYNSLDRKAWVSLMHSEKVLRADKGAIYSGPGQQGSQIRTVSAFIVTMGDRVTEAHDLLHGKERSICDGGCR